MTIETSVKHHRENAPSSFLSLSNITLHFKALYALREYIGLIIGDSAFIVTLPNGKIRGVQVQNYRNSTYYAYLGIPYAAPPVGRLRFKAPQPALNWSGILDATRAKNICYQVQKDDPKQSEDCLYLDVFTPIKPTTHASLPVMVNIYGGTFTHGKYVIRYRQPEFLVEQNVVVVSFNYRVGPFGFLSTEDNVIHGNWGLKDQLFALKWVKNNIVLFGGDPDKITLIGQSAGAASVTYHILSSKSNGLFRAGIAQSGSALTTWAYQRNAVDTAYGIASMIDPSFTKSNSTEELLNLLQKASPEAIKNTDVKYHVFAPVIEVEHDEAFITEPMHETVQNGNINKVPLLIGINSEESINRLRQLDHMKNTLRNIDKNPRLLVDPDMYITDSNILLTVGNRIKKIYSNSTFIDHLAGAIQYYSDNTFTRGIIRFAELQSKHTDVYFYQFSYHGILGNNSCHLDGIGRVSHVESGRYFWSNEDTLDGYPESDILTVKRYVGLLTNFAKTLNPTPSAETLYDNVIWPKVHDNKFPYLDIDKAITIKENPRGFSYPHWVQIYETYAKKPIISF